MLREVACGIMVWFLVGWLEDNSVQFEFVKIWSLRVNRSKCCLVSFEYLESHLSVQYSVEVVFHGTSRGKLLPR